MDTSERIELYDRMARDLYVAVISDILDSLGFRNQVMDAGIKPVDPLERRALVGRAHTVLMAPIHELIDDPYTIQIAAIDAVQPGDVGVEATGGITGNAFWGELFSNAVIGRGGRGMVMDGYHRDTRKILELGFPVFSTGSRPYDLAGRAQAIDFGCPVSCGDVVVKPGDIVFAEIDGIAIIPEGVAEETVRLAFEKVASEDRARDDLRAGALLSEVWQKYRVL